MEFQLSGVLTVDCKNEPYTLNSGYVDLTNIENSNDCIKSTLENNHAELKEIEYDADNDELTVKVKYRFFDVEVHLYKSAASATNSIDWDLVEEFATDAPSVENHHHYTVLPDVLSSALATEPNG